MLQGVRRVAAARTRLRTVLASRAAGLHSSPVALERILCSDPIDGVCAKILRERGHTVDEKGADKMSPAELKKIIGEYDGLIVRRCAMPPRAARARAEGEGEGGGWAGEKVVPHHPPFAPPFSVARLAAARRSPPT